MSAQPQSGPEDVDAEHRHRGVHRHLRQPGEQGQCHRRRDAEPQCAAPRETERTRPSYRGAHRLRAAPGSAPSGGRRTRRSGRRSSPHRRGHRRAYRGQHPGQQHHQCRRHPQEPHPPVQFPEPPEGDGLTGPGAEQTVHGVGQDAREDSGDPAVPRDEQTDRHAHPHAVGRAQQGGARDPPGVGVADRRVRRRREARRHGRQSHRDQRGHCRPHHTVQDVPAGRQRGPAGGEQREQQHPRRPQGGTQQRGPGVHGEPDLGLRAHQIAQPVRQRAAEIPEAAQPAQIPEATEVTESGNVQVPRPRAAATRASRARAQARQRVEAQRAPVERDDLVSRPAESADHRREQHDHRARPREEFPRRGRAARRPQRSQEEPGQQQRADQPDTQGREPQRGRRLRSLHPPHRHVTGGPDRPARAERDHRGGHRRQFALRVRLQQTQPERGGARHPEDRPADARRRAQQHVLPRHTASAPRGSAPDGPAPQGPVPTGPSGRHSTHDRSPDPRTPRRGAPTVRCPATCPARRMSPSRGLPLPGPVCTPDDGKGTYTPKAVVHGLRTARLSVRGARLK
nr:hypothetical protein [Streptomyces sp. MH191]